MIAAVLGNAKNRATFQQSFWWHDDRGFRLYLKAAKGDPVVREIKDPGTGKIVKRRTPSVVLLEKPPSPQTAKANWRRARERLLSLKREVDAELKALEGVRQLCLRLVEMRRNLADGEAALNQLNARRQQAEAYRSEFRAQVLDAKKVSGQCMDDVARHRRGILGTSLSNGALESMVSIARAADRSYVTSWRRAAKRRACVCEGRGGAG